MRLLPVVGRELGAIARRPSSYWVRTASALAAFVALGYVLLVGATGGVTVGRNLFEILSTCAFFYCAIAGIRGTADALSSEKREGTLGLLFLTDLKGYDVVLGKFVSLSITSIYGILAVVPALALSFMSGGVSAQQFFMMCGVLLNTLFFSLAIGIFVSTFAQQERTALGGALAIVFCAFILPYANAMAHTYDSLEVWEALIPGFLIPSPFFAFYTASDPTLSRIFLTEYSQSIAFTNLLGCLALVTASACVAQRAHLEAPRSKIITLFWRIRHRWAYGKAELRRTMRGKLLDRNAFAWLAARDRLKSHYAWIFLGMLGLLWFGVRWKAPDMIDEWPVTLAVLWFFHGFFKLWIASEVATRFIEDRRTNALELLLTTPMDERAFALGERLALLRQFGPPLAVVTALDLFAGYHARDTGYLMRSGSPIEFFIAGLVHLAVDFYAIMWVGMWRSLRSRGANRTIVQTIFLVIFVPVLSWFAIYQASWMFSSLWQSGAITPTTMLWVWTISAVVYELILSWIARHAFLRDFRSTATQTFDKPTPVRLKFWRKEIATAIAQPRARTFKRKLRILASAGVILLIAYIAIVARRRHLATLVNTQIASIRRSGMPMNLPELGLWRPAPASAQNGSELIRNAVKLVVQKSRIPSLRGIDAHWNSTQPLASELRTNIGNWIAQNHAFYKAIEPIASMKGGGVAVQDRYRVAGSFDTALESLRIKARLEMEDDPVAAAKTIADLLHVQRIMQREPFGAFGNPRRALEGANDVLQRCANQGNFQRKDWLVWREILEQLDPITGLRDNLIIERARGIPMFGLPVDELYAQFGRQYVSFQWEFNIGWSIRRFVGQDIADFDEYLGEMTEYIATADKPFAEAYRHSRRVWRMPSLGSSTFIAPQITPAFDWLLLGATTQLAHQRTLMAACDVEMYRSAQGGIPDSWASIQKPQLVDPFNQKPLIYKRTTTGYVIYSVGEDLIDDGGVRNGANRHGDVVFRCGAESSPSRRER